MANTEQAIWKTYPEFPFIEANQFGEIRTKDRTITDKNGKKRHIKGKVLRQNDNGHGYLQVRVGVDGKLVHLYVHRIVATCFIPNPNGYPVVNHIDNDRTNNSASNLEWCTKEYNEAYKKNFGTSQAEVSGRSVIAINPETFEIFWFETQLEAERQLGAYHSDIVRVINGKRNKAGGCWFCRVDENAVEKAREKFGDVITNKVEKLINELRN